MKPEPTLTFDKLGCSKGGRALFQGVDCRVESGRWLHVQGANGIGKTSLLRMLCGLSPIESGDIRWCGQSIAQQRRQFQQNLCYLGHLNGLQEALTVQENLVFTTTLRGQRCSHSDLQSTLVRFGVGGRKDQLVRQLSQGQKRRVALARLALSPAPLWVLDEPFVAMDDSGIAMLAELIAQHLRSGGIAVLTSHQQVAIGAQPAQTLQLHA